MKKFARLMIDWFKDLFYDSTNNHLDNGRVLAAVAVWILLRVILWNMHLKQPINLAELGTCLTGVLGALAVYVYHDRKTNGT